MTVNGIDVASYQSSDYSSSGLDFVVAKATEGTGYTNPKHAAQVATAREHGLIVGHYHFARPGSMSAQADYFLRQAQPKDGDFLAFDWEDTGVSGADKDAWLRYLKGKAPEHRVILYSNRDFWLHRDRTSYCADGLWVADPSAPKGHPRVEHPWLFHQYSDAGGIDRNTGNFADRTALAAWAGAPAPKSLPKVSLARLIAAYKHDPGAKQGATVHAADVRPFEAALKKLGYLPSKYASDGSYGTVTVDAFHAFRVAYSKKHHLGWSTADCSGAPGMQSLRGLASESDLFSAVA